MAYTLDADVSGSIDIDEYIDFVTRTVDLNDEDSILESASMLKALSNNSEFIATRFNDELLAWSEFQTGNGYSSQTLMLGRARSSRCGRTCGCPRAPTATSGTGSRTSTPTRGLTTTTSRS
ncbi:hypothetical protein [Nocardioides plantarum]|uniref:hypothetical protein n=1 Tax=Nocardioides plantarum TaxID=29299 RepID=UPI0036068E57